MKRAFQWCTVCMDRFTCHGFNIGNPDQVLTFLGKNLKNFMYITKFYQSYGTYRLDTLNALLTMLIR